MLKNINKSTLVAAIFQNIMDLIAYRLKMDDVNNVLIVSILLLRKG